MIDPTRITNFNRSDRELELFWLFCLMVAGKNADQMARKLTALCAGVPDDWRLFEWLIAMDLPLLLREHKIGQYTRIERAIRESARLDLRDCTVADLEAVYGVGPKTARFFLLHSRPGVEVAVLDTHILRWIREKTYFPAPQSTPPKGNKYSYWESIALSLMRSQFPRMAYADADLLIWSQMSGRLA